MKIAVTGGRGRIGRAVTALAVEHGHSVVNIDQAAPAADLAGPQVSQVQADLTNYDAFEHAVTGCAALVHLAAIIYPDAAPDHVVHNTNVTSSYNALSAAARLHIRRVCQASSINAIGSAFSRAPRYDYFPIDEQHPTYTEDPYSLSKWICEQQADSFARLHDDMHIASMRFHWVIPDHAYGVQHRDDLGDMLHKHLWAWTGLRSAARACLLALSAGFSGHEAFHIVAPDTIMDAPTHDLVARQYPHVPVRGDLSGHRSLFDSSKAERMLGWRHGQPD